MAPRLKKLFAMRLSDKQKQQSDRASLQAILLRSRALVAFRANAGADSQYLETEICLESSNRDHLHISVSPDPPQSPCPRM